MIFLDAFVIVMAFICIHIAASGYCVKRRTRDNQVLTLTILASILLVFNQVMWIVDYQILGNIVSTTLMLRSCVEVMFMFALCLFGFKR